MNEKRLFMHFGCNLQAEGSPVEVQITERQPCRLEINAAVTGSALAELPPDINKRQFGWLYNIRFTYARTLFAGCSCVILRGG